MAGDSSRINLETWLDQKIASDVKLSGLRTSFRRAALEHFSRFPKFFTNTTGLTSVNVFVHVSKTRRFTLNDILKVPATKCRTPGISWPKRLAEQLVLLFDYIQKLDEPVIKSISEGDQGFLKAKGIITIHKH